MALRPQLTELDEHYAASEEALEAKRQAVAARVAAAQVISATCKPRFPLGRGFTPVGTGSQGAQAAADAAYAAAEPEPEPQGERKRRGVSFGAEPSGPPPSAGVTFGDGGGGGEEGDELTAL